MHLRRFFSSLTRKKTEDSWFFESPLKKCLTTFDLTAFGISAVVDAGLYVVVGQLAHTMAGPSVVISLCIAVVAVLLAALCFSEFVSRIPKAGSAYIYTYISMGEIWAFMVGWSLLLRYIIDAASLARACSIYVNSLSEGAIYKFFTTEVAQWHSAAITEFPDFLALAIAVVAIGVVCGGVNYSRNVVNGVTLLNITIVLFIIGASLPFLDSSNWSTANKFAPFGVAGILQATTRCFYGFTGFDCITTAGEETIEPQKTIPRSIFLTLGIGFVAYFSVSTVLTLMVPYHSLNTYNPLAEAFTTKGFYPAKYIVAAGALCAMLGSLVSTVFSTPRILYSMSCDGLLCSVFTKVHKRTRVPLPAILFCGFIISLLAVFLDMMELVEMVSICCLVPYTMVAISVLLARYQPGTQTAKNDSDTNESLDNTSDHGNKCKVYNSPSKIFLNKFFPVRNYEKVSATDIAPTDTNNEQPTHLYSPVTADVTVGVLLLALSGLNVMLLSNWWYMPMYRPLAILLTVTSSLIAFICLLILRQQPTTSARFPFMVPAVPYVPALSIFVNLFIFVRLQYWTYIRFTVWMVFGFIVYFGYSYSHSIEGHRSKPVSTEGMGDTPDIPITERKSTPQPEYLMAKNNLTEETPQSTIYSGSAQSVLVQPCLCNQQPHNSTDHTQSSDSDC